MKEPQHKAWAQQTFNCSPPFSPGNLRGALRVACQPFCTPYYSGFTYHGDKLIPSSQVFNISFSNLPVSWSFAFYSLRKQRHQKRTSTYVFLITSPHLPSSAPACSAFPVTKAGLLSKVNLLLEHQIPFLLAQDIAPTIFPFLSLSFLSFPLDHSLQLIGIAAISPFLQICPFASYPCHYSTYLLLSIEKILEREISNLSPFILS